MAGHRVFRAGSLVAFGLMSSLLAPFVLSGQTQGPSVVINEVAWGGTAANASDEWIELFNPGSEPVDLSGWRLAAADGEPSIALQGTIVGGGFFLLERSDDATVSDVPADQVYTGNLSNSGEALELRDAAGNRVDTANGDDGAWPAGSGSPQYRSMERTDWVAPDADSNWHSNDGAVRNGLDADGNPINGTPRQPNSPPPPMPTPTDTPTASPTATDVPTVTPTATGTPVATPTATPTFTPWPTGASLNEFMPDPAADWNGNGTTGDEDDEYIELYNANGFAVDLGGWMVDDVAGGGSAPYGLPDGTVIPARGYLLLFRNQTGVALNNSGGDSVRLLSPDGAVVDQVAYTATARDEAYSKTVDGGTVWARDYPPSPGASNQPPPFTPTPTPSPTPSTATLGGWVFEDRDQDGVYEPWAGEAGIGGVLVMLSNGASKLTGPTGFYNWHNLPPGRYTVRQAQPVHTTSTTPDEVTVTVAGGDELDNVSFGEVFLPSEQVVSPVALNEFLPSPASDWDGDGVASTDDEWIELFNRNAQPLDLSGWFLDDEAEAAALDQAGLSGPQGTVSYLLPPGTVIPGRGFLVIYRRVSGIALNNDGDSVRLLGPGRYEVESFAYGSTRADVAWSKTVDGGDAWTQDYPPSPGGSNQPGPAPTPTVTSTFTVSPTPGSTPTPTPGELPSGISLNEFMPDPANDWNEDGVSDALDEYIELYNANDLAVNVGGWQLDDVDDTAGRAFYGSAGSRTYVIPPGTVIPARGFLVFFRAQTGVALNNDGDQVRLLHPDGVVVEAFEYPTSGNDEAYSKTADGGAEWTRDYPPSPGSSNQAGAPPPTATATPTPTPTPTPMPTVGPLPAGISLNEFMPDPAGDWNGDGSASADDEYIELYNSSDQPVDLGGAMLDDEPEVAVAGPAVDPGGTQPYVIAPGTVIPARGLLVFFRSQTGVALNNDADSVRLLAPDGSEVERFDYTTSRDDLAYSKTVDGGNVWATSYPPSPGEPNRPGFSGDDLVRLNEVLPAPKAVDWDGDGAATYQDEWIELVNAGPTTVNLAGWKLTDNPPPEAPALQGATGSVYTFPGGATLAPGQWLVVYRRQSGLALNPDKEEVRLLFPDDSEADVFFYDSFPGYDQAWCRLPDAVGEWRRDCVESPGAANQGEPDGGGGSEGGGAAAPPYDRFNHDLVSIAQARSLSDGLRVTVEGQVTALPGVFGDKQIYVQDATGGLLIYLRSGQWPPLSEGQWVRLNGWLDTFHGEKEIRLTRVDDIKTLAPAAPPAAQPIRTGAVGEASEGRLVAVTAPVSGFYGESSILLNDGSGEAWVVVLESTGMQRPYVVIGDVWTAVGIVSQDDFEAPYDGYYRLLPRRPADLQQGAVNWASLNSAPLYLPVTGEPSEGLAAPVHSWLWVVAAVLGAWWVGTRCRARGSLRSHVTATREVPGSPFASARHLSSWQARGLDDGVDLPSQVEVLGRQPAGRVGGEG